MASIKIEHCLLASAMEAQHWDTVSAVPDTDRYLRALSGQQPLTAAERKQLWLSPTARCFFFEAREIMQRNIASRWRSERFQTAGLRLAADSDEQDRALVRTADFELSLQRDDTDPAYPEWLLRLKLEPRLVETLTAGQFGVAVKDEGGLVWFDGVPDEDGSLSAVWGHQESPLWRLRRFIVHLTVA